MGAVKEIGLLDVMDSFPGGLDYHVGEEGKNLSLGQRQLISFVRIYLSNSSIVVFDEATSSLDSQTEQLIQKAFNKFYEEQKNENK